MKYGFPDVVSLPDRLPSGFARMFFTIARHKFYTIIIMLSAIIFRIRPHWVVIVHAV